MEERLCENCGDKFKQKVSNQKYCSPHCNAVANKAGNLKRWKERKEAKTGFPIRSGMTNNNKVQIPRA